MQSSCLMFNRRSHGERVSRTDKRRIYKCENKRRFVRICGSYPEIRDWDISLTLIKTSQFEECVSNSVHSHRLQSFTVDLFIQTLNPFFISNTLEFSPLYNHIIVCWSDVNSSSVLNMSFSDREVKAHWIWLMTLIKHASPFPPSLPPSAHLFIPFTPWWRNLWPRVWNVSWRENVWNNVL